MPLGAAPFINASLHEQPTSKATPSGIPYQRPMPTNGRKTFFRTALVWSAGPKAEVRTKEGEVTAVRIPNRPSDATEAHTRSIRQNPEAPNADRSQTQRLQIFGLTQVGLLVF